MKKKEDEGNTSRDTKRKNICVISRDQHVLSLFFLGLNQWKNKHDIHTHTHTQAKSYTMCHKKRKEKRKENHIYEHMIEKKERRSKRKTKKEKRWVALHIHKQSTVNTTKKLVSVFFSLSNVFNKSFAFVFAKFVDKNFECELGGKYRGYLSSQNKMALLLLLL